MSRRPKPRKDFAEAPTADYGADLGPAARRRQSAIVKVGGEQRSSTRSDAVYARRFTCECYVDELHANRKLTDRQWKAGMMFRGKWLVGARHTPVTGLYGERTDKGDATSATEYTHSARQQLTDAIRHLGMWASSVVIAICGEDEQRADDVPVLVLGLDALADFWKLDEQFRRE